MSAPSARFPIRMVAPAVFMTGAGATNGSCLAGALKAPDLEAAELAPPG